VNDAVAVRDARGYQARALPPRLGEDGPGGCWVIREPVDLERQATHVGQRTEAGPAAGLVQQRDHPSSETTPAAGKEET
jgi:hypothetical protein